MAEIRIAGDQLIVELTGWEPIWALRRRIEVPLRAIERVVIDPAISRKPEGFRAPGSYWPGKIMAGTYRKRGWKAFWSVRNANRAIVIDLKDAQYNRLVLEVSDPMATVAMIESSIK